ncbi:MAG: carboxypeptidase-like regulatory domain-containing protein [Planctomycetes bacterium]|jgi:hypothetical protein|nr:carboxypeptidase-like regulatory domain-containing protein [Planctomycetota bacterium]
MANQRSRFLAVLVAVGAIVATAWWLRPTDPSPLPAAAPAVAPAVDPAPAATVAPTPASVVRSSQSAPETSWADVLTDPEAAPVAMDPLSAGAAVLHGRLTVRQQPWQHPAGLEVRLTRSWLDSVIPTRADAASRAPRTDEPRTTTDADGFFTLGLVPDAGELFLLIGRDTEWHDFQQVKAVPRTPGTIELGEVFLDLRGSIRGRVVGGHDWGLAQVELRAVDDPLGGASSAFDELQQARTAGTARFQADGTLPGGPMPDWVARRDLFLPFPKCISRADGSFELRGLRPGRHDVFATAPRAYTGSSRGILVEAGAVTDLGELRISYPSPVELGIYDEQQRPWVGAPVAFLHRASGFGSKRTRTDASGRVEQQLADAAEYDLLFGYSDQGPWVQLPWQHDSMGSRLIVPRPRSLRIVLADPAGNPLAGGSVSTYFESLEFRPVDRRLPPSMQPRETAPGEYRGERAGPVVVIASAPRHAPAVAVVPIDEHDIVVTLLPLLSMTVETRDLEGRPVANAIVRLQAESDPELRFHGAQWSALGNGKATVGRTDANGEAVIPVWSTRISLQATHPDFAPSAGPRFVATSDCRQRIVMKQRAEVIGQLLLQQRPAPKGYRVRARQKPPAGHELEGSPWLVEQLAVTGDDGTFAFRALPSGLWELAPELPPIPTVRGAAVPARPFRKRLVQLDDGQVLHCVLEGQQDQLAPASLFGTVTQNGATIPGAIVRLRLAIDTSAPVRSPSSRRSPPKRSKRDNTQAPELDEAERPWPLRCDTDALGDYRFSDLPAGDYELRVDLPRPGRMQLLAQRRVQIAGGNAPPQPLPIAIQAGTLQLICTEKGQPVPFRMLRLQQDGDVPGGRFEVLLDRLGTVDLAALPSGTWRLEPVHGGSCTPNRFELLPGQGLSLAIEFEPR